MSIFENIKMALSSIFDNKLRSFLTMISIIIGISSVIALVSIGRGVSTNLIDSILETNQGLIHFSYQEPYVKNTDTYNMYSNTDSNTYNEKQIDALSNLSYIDSVVLTNSQANVSVNYYEEELLGQRIETLFSPANFEEVFQLKQGRIFSEQEFVQGHSKVMIHQESATKLFGANQNPIGEDLIIGGKIFMVVGVYDDRKPPIGMNGEIPRNFYIPFEAWIGYQGKKDIHMVSVKPKKNTNLQAVGEGSVAVLNEFKDVKGSYQVVNFDDMLRQVNGVLGVMTSFVSMIASISLLVGGIGVMNIMYVSVVERTHEIGLRKALGATNRQVLIQFLIESIAITILGGLLGVALGILGNLLAAVALDYTFVINVDIVIIGVLFAGAVGLVFGVLPARKAARMQPIDALRSF